MFSLLWVFLELFPFLKLRPRRVGFFLLIEGKTKGNHPQECFRLEEKVFPFPCVWARGPFLLESRLGWGRLIQWLPFLNPSKSLTTLLNSIVSFHWRNWPEQGFSWMVLSFPVFYPYFALFVTILTCLIAKKLPGLLYAPPRPIRLLSLRAPRKSPWLLWCGETSHWWTIISSIHSLPRSDDTKDVAW